MRLKALVLAAVFLLSFLRLSFRVAENGIASGHVDPVSKIAAQDEAVYSHIALHMARTGDWLTPQFLGRYALFKPPALYWLSGAATKLPGPLNFSLRLPSLAAGALLVTVAVAWALPAGIPAAAATLLFLLSNPLVHILSRLNLTDALLAALLAVAALCLKRDPALTAASTPWIYAAAAATAIMTKAIAGALVIVLLLLFTALVGRESRPPCSRLWRVFLIVLALAVPWHLYQFAVHPIWFWSEYIVDEHLRSALAPFSQTSEENQALFYLRRWLAIDPVLLAAFALALPGFIRALFRRRDSASVALACWIAVPAFAVLLFSYRNVAYALPLAAPCALVAATFGPLAKRWILPIVLAAVLVVRITNPGQPWGLSFPQNAQAPSAQALASYAARQRPNDLILALPDDQFYSTLLPLPRVRYCFVDDGRSRRKPAMDFRYLGITVSVDEFLALDSLRPQFLERLRRFDLDSAAPLATVIELRSESEIGRLIAGSPRSDFFLPARFRGIASGAHTATEVSDGRFFLLAN